MEFLKTLGIEDVNPGASTGRHWIGSDDIKPVDIISPVDGRRIAAVRQATGEDYQVVMEHAARAFKGWREVPAPARGDFVRRLGLALRRYKEPLGRLVSYEMGKSLQEGWGKCRR